MSKWVNLPRPGKPTARGVVLDLGLRRPYTSGIIIRCASYPEWLRDGPCDATATGPPSRWMLVLTPSQPIRAETRRGWCRWERLDGLRWTVLGPSAPAGHIPIPLGFPLPHPG